MFLGAILALLLIGGPLLACGPNFPNMLLNEGDHAVLAAPTANFAAELERMRLVRPKFQTIPPTNGYLEQTWNAELQDLRTALERKGFSRNALENTVKRHSEQRQKLQTLAERSTGLALPKGDSNPTPIEELPEEFADYFRGSIHWHTGEIRQARKAWEHLLQLRPDHRQFKSTWAAFMLAKAELTEPSPDMEKAIRYFEQVRQLASEGFSDTLGLAASSIGWQAQAYYNSGNPVRAIELYLEQAAGNDASAVVSLQWAADRVMNGDRDSIRAAARNPRVRTVITARLTSSMPAYGFDQEDTRLERVVRWLEAVELADVHDVVSAEKLALAAYQAGRMEVAQRWLDRANQATPTSRWLQAKLRFFRGDINCAASILAKLAHDFPVQPEPAGIPKPDAFGTAVRIDSPENIPAANHVLGELAVLQLNRREYTEALDALLRSGFWIDAAYVAERVLTIEELRRYVDFSWPLQEAETQESEAEQRFWAIPNSPSQTRSDLRYLLARRLARAGRLKEAAGYYPKNWQGIFADLRKHLNTALDLHRPKADQAAAWFDAAQVTRSFGLELYGTEGAPDWRVYGGNFEYGVDVESRTSAETGSILKPTADELDRANRHHPDPDKRFHYRYRAADLAMTAANLLPDNNDETARILCVAGSWLKNRDPEAADVFYKLLVRRCRKTAIGAEADRIRWFPKIDANGKLIPRAPRQQPNDPPPEQDLPSIVAR